MRKYLFLYLTLACFFGLIAIFVADGYMGVYDSLEIRAGEQIQKIEADFWLREDRVWSTRVGHEEKIFFRYKVANRRFSTYTADVAVSIWHSQEKVLDLEPQTVSVASFDEEELEWIVDNARIVPGDLPQEQGYEYSVVIKRGETERRLIMYVITTGYLPKPLVVPVR